MARSLARSSLERSSSSVSVSEADWYLVSCLGVLLAAVGVWPTNWKTVGALSGPSLAAAGGLPKVKLDNLS